jgi:hypothetical protein
VVELTFVGSFVNNNTTVTTNTTATTASTP